MADSYDRNGVVSMYDVGTRQRFRLGDIVRRASGWTPMEIVGFTPTGVQAVYCHGGPIDLEKDPVVVVRPEQVVKVTAPDYELKNDWKPRLTQRQAGQLASQITNPKEKQKEEKKMAKTELYQTKEDTPRFGTKLAVNAKGLIVLDMKGTGDVIAFDPKDIEVVRPYTVAIEFANTPGREYHYLSVEGAVAVGDLILPADSLTSFNVARVTKINTKSDLATVELHGVKLHSTVI